MVVACRLCVDHDAIRSACLLVQIPGHGLVTMALCRQLMQWYPDRVLDSLATDEEKQVSKFVRYNVCLASVRVQYSIMGREGCAEHLVVI